MRSRRWGRRLAAAGLCDVEMGGGGMAGRCLVSLLWLLFFSVPCEIFLPTESSKV